MMFFVIYIEPSGSGRLFGSEAGPTRPWYRFGRLPPGAPPYRRQPVLGLLVVGVFAALGLATIGPLFHLLRRHVRTDSTGKATGILRGSAA